MEERRRNTSQLNQEQALPGVSHETIVSDPESQLAHICETLPFNKVVELFRKFGFVFDGIGSGSRPVAVSVPSSTDLSSSSESSKSFSSVSTSTRSSRSRRRRRRKKKSPVIVAVERSPPKAESCLDSVERVIEVDPLVLETNLPVSLPKKGPDVLLVPEADIQQTSEVIPRSEPECVDEEVDESAYLVMMKVLLSIASKRRSTLGEVRSELESMSSRFKVRPGVVSQRIDAMKQLAYEDAELRYAGT